MYDTGSPVLALSYGMIHIAIVEPDPFMRKNLIELLSAESDFIINAATPSEEELCQESRTSTPPDVIIVSTQPSQFPPASTFPKLREAFPAAKLLFVIPREHPELLHGRNTHPAEATVLQEALLEELAPSIRKASLSQVSPSVRNDNEPTTV